MADEMISSRPDFGKTFTTAMWLLGGLAAAQMVAVGWALVTRPEVRNGTAGVVSQPATVPAAPAPAAAIPVSAPPIMAAPSAAGEAGATSEAPQFQDLRVDPNFNPFEAVPGSGGGAMAATAPPEAPPSPDEGEFSAAQAAGRDGLPPALRDSLLPGGTFNGVGGRKPLASALAEAALAENPAHRISDPVLDRSVSAAAEYRANGDMVEALKALRQAESVLPNHPRVLSELATTFSAMGQDQRAAVYWRKVRDLGGQGGGGYYDIAGSELSGDRLGAAAARAVLRLGKIAAIPDTAATEGERVVLRVEVLADPVTRPRSDEMAMLVYFYDEVDGAKTQATTADTAQNFVSDPYDWTSGLEVIEVEYYQPPFTPEQKRELGARRYKGYIVELYYRDELQDVAADPAELRALDPTVPMPEPEPVETIGPDSSLFPSPPVPENP